MRSTVSAVLVALLAAAGCTIAPLNGTATGGNVVGRTFTFTGFYDTPGTTIQLQVMKNPTLDPSLASSWSVFATAVTGNDPLDVNDPAHPLYVWEVSAAPVGDASQAARWPQGGLVRIRAVNPTPTNGTGVLTTFDAVTYNDCQGAQLAAGATWFQLGAACEGVGVNTAAFVSTTNRPTAGFLTKKGIGSTGETFEYYKKIAAPLTLADFIDDHDFPAGERTATYYNDGDLGIGREMHCKSYMVVPGGTGVACYVHNYSGIAGQAVFDQDPNTVLADAVAHQHKFATVAMVAEPPFDAPNAVRFMVYDASGDLALEAQLDSTGANKSIPQNCMSCHGIESQYESGQHTVTGGKFLPFDPFSFKYSTQLGYTYAAQANALRQLNALVDLTGPSPATHELIAGMYAPKLVTDPTAVANPDFLPADWASLPKQNGRAIYDGVIKVGCRTCHVSATEPDLDFADATDFENRIDQIKGDVCGSHLMPHAERVMKKFWASGARAYLVTAYPPSTYPDPPSACTP